MSLVNSYSFALEMLSLAEGFAEAGTHEEGGNNRGPQVEKFLAVCGLGPGYPWCAAFLVYCGLKALAHRLGKPYTAENAVDVFKSLHPELLPYFLPSPSCGAIARHAQRQGKWIAGENVRVIRRGWLVLFNFSGGSAPEHIEICASAWLPKCGPIRTVGGNTSDGDQTDGDGVAARRRALGNVVGVVALY